MFEFEKEYFTFSELQDRWNVSRSDIDFQVLSLNLVPSFFVEREEGWDIAHVLGDPLWESDDPYFIEDKSASTPGMPNRFLYLREPKRTGLTNYEFKIGCTEPNVERSPDINIGWYRFDDVITSSDSRIVFLRRQVHNFEERLQKEREESILMKEDLVRMREAGAAMLAKSAAMKEITNTNPESTFLVSSLISDEAETNRRPMLDKELNGKSETAHLCIIGALCDMYWRLSRPDQPEIICDHIISDLVEKYKDFTGISDSNLSRKLPRAIKLILS